jgi:hypothetical protein
MPIPGEGVDVVGPVGDQPDKVQQTRRSRTGLANNPKVASLAANWAAVRPAPGSGRGVSAGDL